MFDHLPMPPADRQYYSLGTLCQQLQLLPPALLQFAAQCGVEAAEWRDGVPYFRGDAVEKLCAELIATREAMANTSSN
jgi:hypothetical protein